jgi:hypothetical protein
VSCRVLSCGGQVDAAKSETAEALVNLDRERHKLAMLEIEVGVRVPHEHDTSRVV